MSVNFVVYSGPDSVCIDDGYKCRCPACSSRFIIGAQLNPEETFNETDINYCPICGEFFSYARKLDDGDEWES